MTLKKIRRALEDKYFDIPFSRIIKNNILNLIFKGLTEQTKNKNRTHQNFYIMFKKPMVVFTCEGVYELHHFSNIIKIEISASFFKLCQWTLFDTPWVINQVIRHYHFQKRHFPNHKIIFLLNTLEEYNALKLGGVQFKNINQNYLIDPKILHPINNPKKFDFNGFKPSVSVKLINSEPPWGKKYINKIQKYAQSFPDSFDYAIS